MQKTYGLIDLFTLAARLLAPFTDAIRAEFAVKAIARPRPSTPPQPTPTPAPVSVPPVVRPVAESTGIPAAPVVGIPMTPAAPCINEMLTHQSAPCVGEITTHRAEPVIGIPATPIVTVPAVADTRPVTVVVTVTPLAVDFTTSIGIPTDPDAGIPATTVADPGPLFVRKKTGGQWRYHVAQADAPGPKFRRLNAGKRVRYEPAASF